VDEPFAVVLRRARIACGVSQKDMAYATGMSMTNMSKFECWQLGVRESTIRRWAAVLGCTVELRLIPRQEQQRAG
jgi:transcriptional regulator with XRE-family HTH domain